MHDGIMWKYELRTAFQVLLFVTRLRSKQAFVFVDNLRISSTTDIASSPLFYHLYIVSFGG